MKNLIVQKLSCINAWKVCVLLLSFLLVLPIGSLFFIAWEDSGEIWHHFWNTNLPIYISSTTKLILGVSFLVMVIGVVTARLVTMYSFRGKNFFEWLLIFPLASPSYVVAYAYTDFLEYAGPVQSSLRGIFGWTSAADYWFPEIRSLGGAIFVFSFVLYPYVYMSARSSFLEVSVNMMEVSRTLGLRSKTIFWKIIIPITRPGIVVGVSLVLMETLNDFGTVDFFAVSTMTTGIVDAWLGMGSVSTAAQISLLMLSLVVFLMFIENIGRANQKFYQQTNSRFREFPLTKLEGVREIIAILICLTPIVIGFILPVLLLVNLAISYFDIASCVELLFFAKNSFVLATTASVLVIFLSLFLTFAKRFSSGRMIPRLARLCILGYAIPGAVLAIGIMIPAAYLDNYIDSLLLDYMGISFGLIISGTIGIVVFAYVVRFFTLGFGPISASLDRISPTMEMSARTLGNNSFNVYKKLHFPLLKNSMAVAFMLVFVDCMKELPATLLLRPFNFETLATHVYLYASDEMLGKAALGSLSIVGVGLVPIIYLSNVIARSRKLN